jgi:hypothetical protein
VSCVSKVTPAGVRKMVDTDLEMLDELHMAGRRAGAAKRPRAKPRRERKT